MNFPDHSPRNLCATAWSYYPVCASLHMRFGLFPVRSPLLGESRLFSLPLGTKMFQFPRFASPYKNMVITGLQPVGLSHSEIRGSRDICSYPRLIAACHVLHRLREPRHPPDALSSFRHNSSYFQLYSESSIFSSQSFQLKVFTYSLVCQYVKDLSPVSNHR